MPFPDVESIAVHHAYAVAYAQKKHPGRTRKRTSRLHHTSSTETSTPITEN